MTLKHIKPFEEYHLYDGPLMVGMVKLMGDIEAEIQEWEARIAKLEENRKS